MTVVLGEGLLEETFTHFRECGRGTEECVVYWTSTHEDPDTIVAVMHPEHVATPSYYEVHGDWLTAFFLDLAATGRRIRAQAHTHRRTAFHSALDDGFPVVATRGFMSVVIPNFGMQVPSMHGAFTAVYEGDGIWSEDGDVVEVSW